MGMKRGAGLSPGHPLPARAPHPLPPSGARVQGAPPGAWARLGRGLSPEPAGSKSRCLTVAGSSLFCSRAVDSAAPCSFPSPTSPGTHPCCASLKALSSQRWLPATSTFTKWSGCITCQVSTADGEHGEEGVGSVGCGALLLLPAVSVCSHVCPQKACCLSKHVV